MADLTSLLSTEVWPWARDTVTIGFVAGLTYKLIGLLLGKWQQMPMMDYKIETYRDQQWNYSATLRVTVYNRAAAPLEFLGITIVSPETVRIRANQRDATYGKTVYGWATLPPSLPGAPKLSESLLSVGVSWPDDGCKAKIQVMMRSKNQLVFRRLSRISITLPKKLQAPQPAANPTKNNTAVKT